MTQRQLRTLSALIVASLSIAGQASGQVVRRDTAQRAAQKKPIVRQASVDSLVECAPVAAPAKKKPVVRRPKTATTPTTPSTAKIAARPTPSKPAAKAPATIVRHAKRVTPKPAKAAPAHTTTVVMCRPVRPLAPLAQETPTETSVVPVPQLASAAAPTPGPVAEDGPPLFVSTAPGAAALAMTGNGSSWLPFSIIPAVFVPFIHSGRTHHGSIAPVDSTPPRDTVPVKPPVDTVPVLPPVDTLPVIPPITPPTTTVPEPGMLVMLSSGLLGLAGFGARRKKR